MSILFFKPFLIGEIENPLSSDNCLAITQDMLAWHKKEKSLIEVDNSKLKIDTKLDIELFEEFMNFSSQETRTALRDLTSNRFLQKLSRKVFFYVLLGRHDFRSIDIVRAMFGFGPARIRLELSWLPVNSFIVPHTDSYAKLFSGMIYLQQEDDMHLGTNFWDSNIINKENIHYKDNLLKAFNKTKKKLFLPKFISEKMYFFIRNNRSWHSVEKIKHPRRTYVRLSLNLNIISEREI